MKVKLRKKLRESNFKEFKNNRITKIEKIQISKNNKITKNKNSQIRLNSVAILKHVFVTKL